MKRSHLCPKCGHNRILYVAVVADLSDGTPLRGGAKLAFTGGSSFLGMAAVGPNDAAGTLDACMCRQCGYVEFYVKDPHNIPVDGRYVRELVGPAPQAGG